MESIRRSSAGLKSCLEAVLGFFYPEVCQLCHAEAATAAEGFVGTGCWRQARIIEPPFCQCCGLPYEGDITTRFECGNCREMELHFHSARAAVVAGSTVLEAVHRYKYQRALWFEPFLAGLLLRAAGRELQSGHWNLIVPVPLHSLKRREREFNQAERLALRLGTSSGVPVNTRLLRRVEYTRTQTQLTRPERAANVRGAFAVVPGTQLDGARVVVVDDVLTTGATTSSCARALREAGAAEIRVWTVARGL